MKSPFLIGKRIYLRPLEMTDGPQVGPWINDPEHGRTLFHRGPINQRAESAYIESMSQSTNDVCLCIAVVDTDQLVGATSWHQIDWRNRHACFGLLIEKGSWGKGYGTEATALMVQHAFQTMNLNRVWLQVYEYNERARRIYERIGFKKEGELRQENFREGRYWNTIVMGLLREEWIADQV